MPNRGSFNRLTGKTTPRNKGKTHWGAKRTNKRSAGRTPASAKAGKAGKAGKPAASKPSKK